MPMPMSTGSFIHESAASLLINNVNAGHIEEEQQIKSKKTVRYRECMKNHAAAMGGNATDGCGEFMPSGEEGPWKPSSVLPAIAIVISTAGKWRGSLLVIAISELGISSVARGLEF